MFQNRKRMFENRKGCSKLEKECSKTENVVILFKKVCKSAIAHRTLKNKLHARTSHAHFQTLSARISAGTSHVRRCDNTHMCAATQRLNLFYKKGRPMEKSSLVDTIPRLDKVESCVQSSCVIFLIPDLGFPIFN